MGRSWFFVPCALALALLAGCSGTGGVGTLPLGRSGSAANHTRVLKAPLGPASIVPNASAFAARPLCSRSSDPNVAACFGSVRTDAAASSHSVAGLAPADLASIYGYPAPGQQPASNQVIGVVVAFEARHAESDLAVYRSYFGLPPCTIANGCFTVIDDSSSAQNRYRSSPDSISPHPTAPSGEGNGPGGGKGNASGNGNGNGNGSSSQQDDSAARTAPASVSANPTSTSGGWADETDIDIETVSAVCSTCQIVLVEAASDNLNDLAAAVTTAVQNGATIVNASFGAPEDSSQTNLRSQFEPAPVKVVAAAGDSGPGAYFPASSKRTIAVSGTTLNVRGNTVSESLWSNSGGGCSAVFSRPRWEPNDCNGMRTVADVAAVADPNTGVAVYDSNLGGWVIAGGTSVAAPVIAGMYALSGDTQSGYGAQTLWYNSGSFTQVLNAGNLDGVGSPNGLAGF